MTSKALWAGFSGSAGYPGLEGPEVPAVLPGCGFSDYFPRPLYQEAQVPYFLEELSDRTEFLYKCARCGDLDLLLPDDLCSPGGGGYPDAFA